MGSFYGGGLILDGSGSSGGAKVYSKTKEEWNGQPGLIAEKDSFYIYTNYETEDGIDIPGLKIGNGINYLLDLPFIAVGERDLTQVFEHIRNAAIHVSAEDRQTWNAAVQHVNETVEQVNSAIRQVNEAVETVNEKVTVTQAPDDPQNIVFSW